MDKKQELKKRVETAMAVEAVEGSPGWKAIEEWIQNEVSSAMNQIINDKTLIGDPIKIAYNQGVAHMGTSLLNYLKVKQAQGESAKNELNKEA